MIWLGLASFLLPLALGWRIADRYWPLAGARSDAERIMLFFLGWPIGVGITSSLFFVASLVTRAPALISGVAELLLLVAVTKGGAALGGARPPGALAPPANGAEFPTNAPGGRVPPRANWLLITLVAQAALVALVLSLRAAHLEPFGSWDGWAIWNLHARFLFRAGPNWPAALAAPELNWTHADYPWLVSAGVARVWSWMGRESGLGSAGFSLSFGVATVGLLGAALWRRRGALAASLAVIVLLSTPFFATFSSNEHADVPFGLYLLAACVLIAEAPSSSRPLALLTGLVIGFAPFVKNEGLLWLPLACIGWIVSGWSATSGRAGPSSAFKPERELEPARPEVARHHRTLPFYFGLGLLFALLPLLYFKLHLAPANDLASSHPVSRLAQLFAPERHRIILSSLRRDLFGFGQWRWAPVLPLALALIGAGWRRLTRSEWIVGVLLGLTFLGYYGVYLLTPFDLHWHVDSSLVRLLLQLWPAALFWWGLAATLPDRLIRPFGHPAFWFAGNVLAGVALYAALHQTLAPGELARNRWSLHPVHLSAADGWYPAETQGSTHWVWSSGRGTLHLDAEMPRSIRLRFAVRGLQPQRLTAQWRGRTIWSAEIGTQLQKAELARLTVPAGESDLIFTSDHPGLPESTDARARTLAFALYQPQIQ